MLQLILGLRLPKVFDCSAKSTITTLYWPNGNVAYLQSPDLVSSIISRKLHVKHFYLAAHMYTLNPSIH